LQRSHISMSINNLILAETPCLARPKSIQIP
jgi:hypothetical protein